MRTVKANLDGDVRRMRVSLSVSATSAETYQEIRAAVVGCFGTEDMNLLSLKYRDEDGDLCTLVPVSVDDMLQLANGGNLNLFASKAQPAEDVSAEFLSQPQDAAAEAVVSKASDDHEDVALEGDSPTPPIESMVSGTSDDFEHVALEADPAPPTESPPPAEEMQLEPAEECNDVELAGECNVSMLTSMGFGETEAQLAFADAHGNVEQALESLLMKAGEEAGEPEVYESDFESEDGIQFKQADPSLPTELLPTPAPEGESSDDDQEEQESPTEELAPAEDAQESAALNSNFDIGVDAAKDDEPMVDEPAVTAETQHYDIQEACDNESICEEGTSPAIDDTVHTEEVESHGEPSVAAEDTATDVPTPTMDCTRVDRVQVFVSRSFSAIRGMASRYFSTREH